jgi:hypothetical protein
VLDDVKTAINILHEQGLVFGDLREPNILIYHPIVYPPPLSTSNQASGSTQQSTTLDVTSSGQIGALRAMLIDFDWCGEHDVDRYPVILNQQITWPQEVEHGARMAKEHDLVMLERLSAGR